MSNLIIPKSKNALGHFILFLMIAGCFVAGCAAGKRRSVYTAEVISFGDGSNSPATPKTAVARSYDPLQIEFANKMKVSPDSIENLRLYAFIKQWLGTPYLWGGTTDNGIDCSAFVQTLYQRVYYINMPRTSIEQFYAHWVDLYKNALYLKEGDLVFFKTIRNSNAVTHVGFYLHNGYFVNASSSKGVSIANIYDNYWSVKYVAAGRLKKKFFTKYAEQG